MLCNSVSHRAYILLSLAVLAISSTAPAVELKPEELVAKHLDAIGSADARKAIKSRAVQGTAQYKILVGGAGTMDGKAVLVSEQNKVHLLLKFANNLYRGEQIVTDGNRIEVAATTQEKTRSPFGDFLYTQDAPVHEGLLGGVLSTAWPLLNLDERKAKVSYQGVKTVDGHQVFDLRYKPKKGSDQEIDLFFDQETFRHVMTVYKISIHPHISSGSTYEVPGGGSLPPQMSQGASVDGQSGSSPDVVQARQQDTRYRIEERFSDFKTADGLTLPTHYNLHFSRELQSGATSVYEWDVNFNDIAENVTLDPRNFQPK
ncbi:MAG TPA: hypothetical protein VFA68_19610 [Terriglobales bacterium]|nr:hypothetical protein [Terriglobales bacterium]